VRTQNLTDPRPHVAHSVAIDTSPTWAEACGSGEAIMQVLVHIEVVNEELRGQGGIDLWVEIGLFN
jgi:hypothetical protein